MLIFPEPLNYSDYVVLNRECLISCDFYNLMSLISLLVKSTVSAIVIAVFNLRQEMNLYRNSVQSSGSHIIMCAN